MLTNMDKSIKLVQYRLSKVVCTEGSSHFNLEPGRETTIDVIESTLIYCKVFC